MKKIKILHITDAFGGGVIAAIDTYVTFSEGCEHHLLTSSPKHEDNNSELLDKFSSYALNLSYNKIKALLQIHKLYNSIQPTYVHLHSSLAGLYGRISGIASEKIIYTPHGYAFQRKDVNIFIQKLFYFSEWALTKISKNSIIAACGPGEYTAALKISNNVVLLGNYADIPKSVIWDPNNIIDRSICMVGRVCPQKGVDFFIETSQLIKKESKLNYQFLWIGDGDEQLKEKLLENNIQVLGWENTSSLLKILSKQHVYFHTAAWDGLPISLLEASTIGLPLIVRETEATHFLSPLTCKTYKEASKQIIDLCENTFNFKLNTIINNSFTKDHLRKGLKNIYQTNSL